MARQYYSITEMSIILQKLLKALKFSFSAEGKNSNLKLLDYIPSEGEIFKEIEPVVTELIATGEAEKRIGPVIISRKPDDELSYNFKFDFALGTMFFSKEDLIKAQQGSLLEGFEGLVTSINDLDDDIDEERLRDREREELIDEAVKLGVIWKKPLDKYELYEIRDAIALRRLAIKDKEEMEEELQKQRKEKLIEEAKKRNLYIDPERDYDITELEAMIESDDELSKELGESCEDPVCEPGREPDNGEAPADNGDADEPNSCYGDIEEPEGEFDGS